MPESRLERTRRAYQRGNMILTSREHDELLMSAIRSGEKFGCDESFVIGEPVFKVMNQNQKVRILS